MKQKTILLSFVAISMLVCACDGPSRNENVKTVKSEVVKADMTMVQTDIQAIENQWADAMNNKDIDALMALYADDAKSMQDGAPTLNGKAAIRAQQEKDFAAPQRYASISFKTLDVYGTPDEVTEVGSSSEKDASGKEIGTGKYMVVFKKIDGDYKCVREIYNKDYK
jgi:ketosteroid isomerase-like protein